MKLVWMKLFILGFVLVFVRPVEAIEMIGADVANVSSTRTVDGSLLIGGNSVTIDGGVHGDVFCAGQTVVISGSVDGDIICAAQNIRITGPVGGNVRVVAQSIELTGAIVKNITIGGQSLLVGETSTIGGEALFGSQSVRLMGNVGKSVGGAGKHVVIGGKVGGDVNLQVETLDISSSATIAGTVRYTSDHDATIATTATVGDVYRSEPKLEESPRERKAMIKPQSWPANTVGGILIHLMIGSILVALFPLFTKEVQKQMKHAPVAVGLKGAGILFFAPVFILALFLTIIGIPVALLGIGLYALPVSLSRVFVATLVGERILEQFSAKNKLNLYWQIIVGVPVLWLLLKAPFVGGFLSFIAVIWGMGGMPKLSYTKIKSNKETVSIPMLPYLHAHYYLLID